jgi:outer membrane protein OmpA-like peptidoglycan-associated protein
MKRLLTLAAMAFVLAACATTTPAPTPPNNLAFDPAACTERRFSVYFDDNAQLTFDAREAIRAVERNLHGCTIEHVRIAGYDEAGGGEEESQEISLARAEAVAAFLESSTQWPRSVYEVVARGDARATGEEGARPMRRRAWVRVTAVPPTS